MLVYYSSKTRPGKQIVPIIADTLKLKQEITLRSDAMLRAIMP